MMRTTYIPIASFCIIAVTVFSASSIFIGGNNKLNYVENSKMVEQIEPKHFDFKGDWYPVKWESCDIAGLSEEDIKSMMTLNVRLDENIVVFFGDSTISPQYKFHREKTFDYININYKIDSKILGITKDSIEILTVQFKSTEATPPYDIIILDDKMLVNIDGIFFFLEKQSEEKIKENIIPSEGDTVRCKFGETKCTGYVIQGSRKSGREVIHVTPQNKNVPKEIEVTPIEKLEDKKK